jgi:hypothetical protein
VVPFEILRESGGQSIAKGVSSGMVILAEQYWARVKEAEKNSEIARDLAAQRTWREVAAHWREMALAAERKAAANSR